MLSAVFTRFSLYTSSNRQFDIEFNSYLSNHAKHAVVALDRLGASAERAQEYWDAYTTETPYGLTLHKAQGWKEIAPIAPNEWKALRSTKTKWQEQTLFLHHQMQATSPLEVLQEYAPALLRQGTAGGLLHGIIHTGWGVDTNDTWMMSEGLAYWNFGLVGVESTVLKEAPISDNATPWETTVRLAREFHAHDLAKTWVEPTKLKYDETFHPELVASGFQWQVAKILKDLHPLFQVRPRWVDETPKDQLWKDLYLWATLLHLTSRQDGHGNFVVKMDTETLSFCIWSPVCGRWNKCVLWWTTRM